MISSIKFAVLVSANAEWAAVKAFFHQPRVEHSPYGELFWEIVGDEKTLFVHGGWGKVSAAASTQYVIDHFKPERLINLGTCGGVEGRIRRFDVLVPNKVVIYDIHEEMETDPLAGISHYTTELEAHFPFPAPVIHTTLHSADSDLTPETLRAIEDQYRPVAVDWESGAIAWVAKKNATPLLIMRGVSDLVSLEHGEAQRNEALFQTNAAIIMRRLLEDLPKWTRAWV